MLILFTITIFLGAFLLFLAQPMIARMVLPQLGGSPAVWNTCMVFFQAALLAGYAYAHWSTKWIGQRRQPLLHAVLVLLPLALLPIALPHWDPPRAGGAAPVLWLLAVLAIAVGLPFFIVSTSAPLLQRWFAGSAHRAAGDPYFLYAASNAGSLLALLAFPAILEPLSTVALQTEIWRAGYILYAACIIACAVVVLRAPGIPPPPVADPAPAAPPAPRGAIWFERLRWLALAFVPSSLMLGVTQYLSTDIAAVPLLWVVPLAVYLLTFIIAFSSRNTPALDAATRTFPMIAVGLAVATVLQARHPVAALIALHLLAFFLAAMVCHGRLSSLRPPAAGGREGGRLTEFYLLIALGGALGGAFNALLAPIIFNSIAEYSLAFVLAAMLLPPGGRAGHPTKPSARRASSRALALDLAGPALLGMFMIATPAIATSAGVYDVDQRIALSVGLPAFLCYLFSRRPLRFALGLAIILFAGTQIRPSDRVLLAQRTFFGVYRVTTDRGIVTLMHGTTTHGLQNTAPGQLHTPRGYYHPGGPIGHVFASLGATPLFDRIGLVGLGTGALAAYGRPGQHMTFHEIDPAIQRIAENSAFFTYLRDSRARYDIVLGDGRLTLERIPDGHYGMIVLDAFSSDAIPIHLMTLEAVELYTRKLAPRGILAFHISNRYLRLEPVLAAIADRLGMASRIARDVRISPDPEEGRLPSVWVLLARTEADLAPIDAPGWAPIERTPRDPLWTDQYSNILGILRW